MKIGDNIRQIRLGQKLDIGYMAQHLNIDNEEYIAIEEDKRDIKLSILAAISQLLSVEPADLIMLNSPLGGIKNFFFNHSGNSGVNIHVQGLDQKEVRMAYKEIYAEELNRIPKLEKLLREYNIAFDC